MRIAREEIIKLAEKKREDEICRRRLDITLRGCLRWLQSRTDDEEDEDDYYDARWDGVNETWD